MSNTENLDGSAAPLLEHLKELRNRIMISIGAFVVTFIIAFLIVGHIWAFLSAPICDVLAERGQECQLQTLGPQDSFFVAMKISPLGIKINPGFVQNCPASLPIEKASFLAACCC
jgi:sec-independent protein translocase protein TatC